MSSSIFHILASQKGFTAGTPEYNAFVEQLTALGFSDQSLPAATKAGRRSGFSVKGLIKKALQENGQESKEYLLTAALIAKLVHADPEITAFTITENSIADLFVKSIKEASDDIAAGLEVAVTELSKKNRKREASEEGEDGEGFETAKPSTVSTPKTKLNPSVSDNPLTEPEDEDNSDEKKTEEVELVEV